MESYLPYLVSVLCAVISGIVSYAICRKQNKEDIEKLERTHELDLEKEKELHKMEIEKLEMEHNHQMELLQKQFENQLGGDIVNTMFSEAMKTPAVQEMIKKSLNDSKK